MNIQHADVDFVKSKVDPRDAIWERRFACPKLGDITNDTISVREVHTDTFGIEAAHYVKPATSVPRNGLYLRKSVHLCKERHLELCSIRGLPEFINYIAAVHRLTVVELRKMLHAVQIKVLRATDDDTAELPIDINESINQHYSQVILQKAAIKKIKRRNDHSSVYHVATIDGKKIKLTPISVKVICHINHVEMLEREELEPRHDSNRKQFDGVQQQLGHDNTTTIATGQPRNNGDIIETPIRQARLQLDMFDALGDSPELLLKKALYGTALVQHGDRHESLGEEHRHKLSTAMPLEAFKYSVESLPKEHRQFPPLLDGEQMEIEHGTQYIGQSQYSWIAGCVESLSSNGPRYANETFGSHFHDPELTDCLPFSIIHLTSLVSTLPCLIDGVVRQCASAISEWVLGQIPDKTAAHGKPISNENCHYGHDSKEQIKPTDLEESHALFQSAKNDSFVKWKKYPRNPSSRNNAAIIAVTRLLRFIVLLDMVVACGKTKWVVNRFGFPNVTDQDTLSRINLTVNMEWQVEMCITYCPLYENVSLVRTKYMYTLRIQQFTTRAWTKYPSEVYKNCILMENNQVENCFTVLRCPNTRPHLMTLCAANQTSTSMNEQRQFAEQSKHLWLFEAISMADVCQRFSTVVIMINVCVIHAIFLVKKATVYRQQDQENCSVQIIKEIELCLRVTSFDWCSCVKISGIYRMPNMTEQHKPHGHSPVQDVDGIPENRIRKNIRTYQLSRIYYTRYHNCLPALLTSVSIVMFYVFVILSYLSYAEKKDGFLVMGNCVQDPKWKDKTPAFDQRRSDPVGKWYLDNRSDAFNQIYEDPILVYPVDRVGSLKVFQKLLTDSPLKVQEHMRLEWARLKSFVSWPDGAPGFPSQMASAGFYYTQDVDKVVCFSCGGAILDWTPNMIPMEEHKIRFPTCAFVLDQNSDNHSIPKGTQQTSSCDPFFILKDPMPTGSSDCSSGAKLTVGLRGGANEINGGYSTITSVPVSDSGYVITPLSHLAAVDSAQPSSFVERMKVESSRRTTFRSWPKPEAVSVLDLVKAGLYYTGNRDEVKCAFCSVLIGNFQRGDSPMSKHRSLFPGCPFVSGIDSSNLEFYPSVRATLEGAPRFEPQCEQSQLVSENLSIQDDMHQLGLPSAKPKHPDFALLQTRVDSYHAWSSAYEQTPRDLAVAGFIYAGMGDCVKCFYCDGGLRNWLPSDLPWAEHARWFPSCLHVKLCKGQEFIETVEQRYPRLPVGDFSSTSAVGVQGAATTDTITSSSTGSLYNLLITPAAQSAIDMGYSASYIKKGLRKYLHERNGAVSALTTQTLMDILLGMEDNGEGISCPADSGDDAPLIPVQSEKKITAAIEVLEIGNDRDNKSLRDKNRELVEQTLCKICLEKKMCITFLPCGHLVSCELCAPALRKCPICRSNIKGCVRVYMS